MTHVSASPAELPLDRIEELPADKALALLSSWQATWEATGSLGAARATCLLSRRCEAPREVGRRLEEALARHPEDGWLLSLSAQVLIDLGDTGNAMARARRAVRLMPDVPMPWLALATVLGAGHRWRDAIEAALSACEVAPADPGPGAVLLDLARKAGMDADAVGRAFPRTREIVTAGWLFAEASLLREVDIGRAVASIEACLALAEPGAEVHAVAADLHKRNGNSARALAHVEKALELGRKQLLTEKIFLLWDLGRHRDAWDLLVALRASGEVPWSTLRLYQALIATNVGRHETSREILKELGDDEYSDPEVGGMLLGVEAYCFDDPATMLRHARVLSREAGSEASRMPLFRGEARDREGPSRLRVGLLSNNFSAHPVSMLTLPAFERLDQDRFDILCFETNEARTDRYRNRFRALAAEWHSLVGLSGREAALVVAKADVDVLIDLQGYSKKAILDIPFAKPAPAQLKWIGMQAFSSGMSTMDCFLSDAVETPDGFDQYYSEKLIRLNRSYVAFEVPEIDGLERSPPCLENGFVTFGCFNNLQKMSPEAFDAWCRILHAVPDAKFLLKAPQLSDADTVTDLRERFSRRGIPVERLMFRGRTARDEQIRAISSVDVVLDPFPYSGGVCTLEALTAGVPVVALAGKSFAARHSASHLTWSGAPELVAGSVAEYVELAVGLAKDPERLVGYRTSLPAGLRRPGGPADVEGFVRDFSEVLDRLGAEAKDIRKAKPLVTLVRTPPVVPRVVREAVSRAFDLCEGAISPAWAMPRDTLEVILATLLETKPSTMLEFGSGVSTIATLLLAEPLGLHRLVTCEHESDWADRVSAWAHMIGKEHLLTVRHRPLVRREWRGLAGDFYDVDAEDLATPVDCVVVDGPPSVELAREHRRAMAGAVVERTLRAGGVVFLEDANRAGETVAYRTWIEAGLCSEATLIEVGRGLFKGVRG